MKRTLAFLIALLVAVPPAYAHAITSYDVSNLPVMFLQTTMTSGVTTGIQLQAPERNRNTFTYPTASGGILRVYQGWKEEFIHYTSASVNATTQIVTLSGVSRQLCISQFDNIQSCGDGLSFGVGAYVELSTASWLLNLKANIDRVNRFRNSGAILCTNRPCIGVGQFTTAQLATFTMTGGTIVLDSTRGVPQMYIGGALQDLTGTGTNFATTTARGVGYAANQAAISGATIPGYPTWIGVDMVIRSSTGDVNSRNKVVATNNTGRVHPSLLGSITPGAASGSNFLRLDGTYASPTSGSGVNLYRASNTSDVTFTASTFTTIHANLEKTVFVNVGSILEMTFTGTCQDGSGVGGIYLDYQIGNGLVRNSASGSLGMLIPDDDSVYNCGFTAKAVSATGGSLVVRPMARQLGATNKIFPGPQYSEITVIR